MKRLQQLIVSAMVISLTMPIASAQFYLGARGGINLASMSTNVSGSENSSIMGIQGGVTTRYQFMKKLSAGGDALFSQFGNLATTVVDDGVTNVTTETTTTISYALVPLYINFEIPLTPAKLVPYRMKESFVSAHLFGGGYFGYALGATAGTKTETIFADDSPKTVTTTPDASLEKTTYNAIDYGIMAGAGVSFRLDEAKRQRMYLDFRYYMGMSDFDATKAGTATNSAIGISVAYSLKLTKRLYTTRHKN